MNLAENYTLNKKELLNFKPKYSFDFWLYIVHIY